MKTKKLYLCLYLQLVVMIGNTQQPLPDGVNSDWYATVTASMRQQQYAIHTGSKPGSFQVSDLKNKLAFQLDPGRYSISPIATGANKKDWTASLSLAGVGRSTMEQPLFNRTTANANIVTYHSPVCTMEFVKSEEGLRQNFIIASKPSGEGILTLALAIETSLERKSIDDKTVAFTSPGQPDNICFYYDGLQVWDANRKPLKAKMSVDAQSSSLVISVDDRDAVYPVTIDPLNRVPEWQTSADGILPGLLNNLNLQVESGYGFTVTALGDINGDGYDDVAVSAPTMANVLITAPNPPTLSGVGAVFIYLGSPAGLKTNPDKVLQPSTAVNGALFGYSVSAGDITGDGKNDIVVGAPLDSYQTAVSGTGSPTATVKAGKVYLYRSEDLFSAPNPSPFLEIKLEGGGYFSNGLLGILGNNLSVNALFGFSVAVTKDLNGDNKADIVVGAPAYLGVDILAVQNGAAFVYYSDKLGTANFTQLDPPDLSLLGIPGLPLLNTKGLLFGFSVDGAGNFNQSGGPDVVVGAPAGVDLSSLGGIFSGQFLGGSAYVFLGNGSSISNTATIKLQASASGLLGNTANLFGYKVRGVENKFRNKTGAIIVTAPTGSVVPNVLGVTVKAGQVHLFKRKGPTASGTYTATQVLTSPRSSSVLSILAGQPVNLSLLYGASVDNVLDANCDGYGDLIVGEPLSSAVPLIGADALGGAAYIYLGQSDSTYNPTPYWDLHANIAPLIGVNGSALVGNSVAGAGYVMGSANGARSLVGGASNALDFGVGLLNLNNTLSTTFNFAFDNNGIGKAYTFSHASCNATLPITLLDFKGRILNQAVPLNWTATTASNFSHFELQRSIDGVVYETIAVVLGKNENMNDYNYTDHHPYPGANYYRLKLVDNDTRFTYSPIVVVRFEDRLPADIVIAPNPVQQEIRIRTTGLEKGMYQAQLMNNAGQVLLTSTMGITQFVQTSVIQRPASMSSGLYWVTLYDSNNRKVASLRVMLQ